MINVSQSVDATINGVITPTQAEKILAKPPTSKRGNMLDYKRIYLYQLYSEIITSRFFSVIQLNNLTSAEYDQLQLDFLGEELKTTFVRNAIFNAAFRDHHQNDSQVFRKDKDWQLSKIKSMLVGPSCIVFIPPNQTTPSKISQLETPDILKKFSKVLAKQPPNIQSKTLVVGTKIDNMVLTKDAVADLIKKYPQGKTGLLAELLGILEMSGARRIIDTLESGQKSLVLDLLQHEKQMKEGSNKI